MDVLIIIEQLDKIPSPSKRKRQVQKDVVDLHKLAYSVHISFGARFKQAPIVSAFAVLNPAEATTMQGKVIKLCRAQLALLLLLTIL